MSAKIVKDNSKNNNQEGLGFFESFVKKHKAKIECFTAVCVFAGAIFWAGNISSDIKHLAEDNATLRVEIQETKTELSGNIKDVSNRVDAVSDKVGSLSEKVATLDGEFNQYRPTNFFANLITNSYGAVGSSCESAGSQLLSASAVVYSNRDLSKEYTVEQIADQALLLPYADSEKEFYFYGQVDETGSWDGHCVVNIYKGDELILITDAQYENGNLLSCKQAFPDHLQNGDDIWSISNRKIKDDHSEGETWRFFCSDTLKKDFTIDSAEPSDIIDADEFKSKVGGNTEGYYSGCNSNGSYNDKTGNAYYVQYFTDGTVDTLYVGRFENGIFQDTTGTAWMIGNDGEGTPYCYYEGPFNQGKPINDPKYWEQPLTVERVKEIVAASGLKFNCELKWEKDKV